jgi:hypothetical protein
MSAAVFLKSGFGLINSETQFQMALGVSSQKVFGDP